MNKFARNLNAVMIERGISQKQMAERTGLSKSGISQYLSGKAEPSDRAKAKLANALDMEISDFDREPEEQMPGFQDIATRRVKKITLEQASKILGQSKEIIRLSLQQGVSPFGYACKGTGDKWVYHISPKKFNEYVGIIA